MENHVAFNRPLVEVASEIDRILSEVILLQQDYVLSVCPACPKPCCQRVRYLFDERDAIFYKVCLNRTVPRKKDKMNGGCFFLSASGCILEPKARPFTCNRYLCAELEKEMTRKKPKLGQILREKFRRLERLRGQLWREYLETPN